MNVKHSAPLANRPLEDDVNDLLHRGGADGLIVSGSATGQPVDLLELQKVQGAASGRAPVLIGSGVTAENLPDLLPHADAFIIGSGLKHDGRVENAVELARVRTIGTIVA